MNNPGSLLFKSNWAYGDRSTNESVTAVVNATYNLEFGDVKNIKFGLRQANSEVDFVQGHYQVDLSCGTKSNGFSDIKGGLLPTNGTVKGVGACIPNGHNLGDIDGDGISDNQLWGPTTRYVDANISNPAFDDASKTSTGKNVGEVLYGANAGSLGRHVSRHHTF
ncbi:MAG: hypothetical protein U5M23_10485 [Marinagarivorans sp.]|nr:hypothetical protein [Marinagarivorans sp.]